MTANVSATCRYYGISAPTFYKWPHRFEEHGEGGLRDGSRSLNSPNETSAEDHTHLTTRRGATGPLSQRPPADCQMLCVTDRGGHGVGIRPSK